jgi:hypothetical protein
VVLPLLAAVAIGLAWLVSLGVTQVRVTDAARETARVLARGESTAAAVALGRQVAPHPATVSVRQASGTVTVTVRARTRGPAGVLAFLPGFWVHGEAVAAREPAP